MYTIQNKILSEVKSNMSYDNCNFHLADKEVKYYLENSYFINCNFKKEIHFSSLERCSFVNCKFSKVVMDLSAQLLEKIPEYVFELNFINVLHLYENKITCLSSSIAKMKNLYQLVLLRNEIFHFPNVITNLVSLDHINLCGNRIKTIPKSISKIENLTSLYLRWNKISKLPKEIGRLSKLRELDLEGNPISKRQQNYIRCLLPNCNIYFGK
ncbi:leucine-rich repeat domain-containing protein [Candidatus Uabimicrobium sp. HlEnr_7]|uniref:leucine-rich repeat domain-containing protein n=1 Tax=Candidatus Uabimicrobium helgolandensis TaxID=3095367 RepID=UPI0035579C73